MLVGKKPIYAMIHLSGQRDRVIDRALKEIQILQEEGVEGIIVENYHGGTRDVINVLKEIKDIEMVVGVNVLPNEYHESLMYGNLYNADFIQLDHVAGTYKRGGTLDVENYKLHRSKYPDIKVMGGVWPKYYEPIDGSDLITDVKSGMGVCDAIVVTGSGTGMVTPMDKINKFRDIVGDFPLIVGAGVDTSNVVEQLSVADGAIVGSSLKPYKRTQELINRDLVQEFMELKNSI